MHKTQDQDNKDSILKLFSNFYFLDWIKTSVKINSWILAGEINLQYCIPSNPGNDLTGVYKDGEATEIFVGFSFGILFIDNKLGTQVNPFLILHFTCYIHTN